jgi:hypothetical protein
MHTRLHKYIHMLCVRHLSCNMRVPVCVYIGIFSDQILALISDARIWKPEPLKPGYGILTVDFLLEQTLTRCNGRGAWLSSI